MGDELLGGKPKFAFCPVKELPQLVQNAIPGGFSDPQFEQRTEAMFLVFQKIEF
jgi:hypothetical protein